MGQRRLPGAADLHALIAAAAALACALSAGNAAIAAREGAALAAAHRAYDVRRWVLWDRPVPTSAQRGRADLDAVIVETPFERIRYEAYLQRLQGLPMPGALVEHRRRESDGSFGFVIYAHSRGAAPEEANFLGRFSAFSAALRQGPVLVARAVSILGVNDDFYDVGATRERRYTGSLTVRFTGAPSCRPAGTFRFADAGGRPYAFSFDLTRYR